MHKKKEQKHEWATIQYIAGLCPYIMLSVFFLPTKQKSNWL